MTCFASGKMTALSRNVLLWAGPRDELLEGIKHLQLHRDTEVCAGWDLQALHTPDTEGRCLWGINDLNKEFVQEGHDGPRFSWCKAGLLCWNSFLMAQGSRGLSKGKGWTDQVQGSGIDNPALCSSKPSANVSKPFWGDKTKLENPIFFF